MFFSYQNKYVEPYQVREKIREKKSDGTKINPQLSIGKKRRKRNGAAVSALKKIKDVLTKVFPRHLLFDPYSLSLLYDATR